MNKQKAYAEAYRRGILPPDKKAAYEQAIKRGLVTQPTEAPAAADIVEAQPSALGKAASIAKDYLGIPQEEAGKLQTIRSNVVRGLGNVAGSIGRGDAVIRERHHRDVNEMLGELATTGGNETFTSSRFKDIERMYMNASPEIRAQIEERFKPRDVSEHFAFQKGNQIRDSLDTAIPRDESLDESMLFSKIPQGVGSMAGFALSGPASPITGASAGTDEAYQRAIEAGQSEEMAFKASERGTAIGATEAIPILSMFRRADKATGGKVKRAVKNALLTGTEESIQEVANAVLQNANEKDLYNPDQGLFEGSGEAAAVGGSTGAIIGFMTDLVAGRRNRGRQIASDPINQVDPDGGIPENSDLGPEIEPDIQPEVEPIPPQPKPRKPKPVDPTKDSLLVAIRKLGGISRAEAEAQGIDPAYFKSHRSSFSKNAGRSLDDLLEGLNQGGMEYNINDTMHLMMLIEDELGGKKHYSNYRDLGMAGDLASVNPEAQTYPLAEEGTWYGDGDYKERGGRLSEQSPDEYLNSVRPLDIDEVSRENIDDLKQHIIDGGKLDPLAVYQDGKEDGRHRAVAAKELGIQKVPVLDFRNNEDLASSDDLQMAGANYAGLVDDATLPRENQNTQTGLKKFSAKLFKSKKPLVRQAIIRKYARAMDVPIYEGRIKSKNVGGLYRRAQEMVRVKKQGDLEVTAHEMAHLIDDRVFNGFGTHKGQANTRPWQGNTELTEELKGVSYDESKVHEGFAEFVRLWMTQPEEAKARAPKFYAVFEKTLDADAKYGPIIREGKADMLAWYAQGIDQRIASKFGETPDVQASRVKQKDEVRQSVLDDFHGFKLLEKELNGEVAEGGIYETFRLTKSASSIVDGTLRFGAPVKQDNGDISFEGDGLLDILKSAGDIKKFSQYATGRAAAELYTQGRENLFTKDEIRHMLELETPAFRKAFNAYQHWNNTILDFAEDSGYLNPEARKKWKRTQYIPFYRVSQDGMTKKVKGMEGISKATQRLTGGSANLDDIVKNMIKNANHLVTESLKNEARTKAVDAIQEGTGGGKFLVKIAKDTKSVSIDKDQVKNFIMKNLGLDQVTTKNMDGELELPPAAEQMLDALDENFSWMQDYLTFWKHGQAPSGDNVIGILRNGKPEYYEVADPLLYRSFQAMNTKGLSLISRGFGKFRRLGQNSVTLTPDFIARNMFRDTLHGWVFSKHGFRPVIDTVRGLRSVWKQDKDYQDFIANGGGMASYLVEDGILKDRLDRFYDSKGINVTTVLTTPQRILDFALRIAEATESATRVGEYKRAREKGKTKRMASFAGREVSTDFAMKGDNQAALEAFNSIMFLKAAMNGLDRAYRGFTQDANRQSIWAKTAVLSGASVALYLANRGNEEYEDLEDWDKYGHWHFFIGGKHYRLPKIWEVGAMTSVAERSVQASLDGWKKEDAAVISEIMMHNFKLEWVPQLGKPLYELGLNKNRFTQRPIETHAEKNRSPENRYNENTSETAKAIGKRTGISPKKVEHLIRGYFNTWGMYGLMLSDEAFHDSTKEARDIGEYPVLRTFMPPEVPRGTKYQSEFWEMYNEFKQLQADKNFFIKQYRPDDLQDLMTDNINKMYSGQILEGGKKATSAMFKEISVIRKSKLSPEQKKQKIDAIRLRINKMYKQSVLQAKKIKDK